MRVLRVLAILGALPLGACNCDPELTVVPGNLEGQVCDPESGVGLNGAGIVIEGGTVVREGLADSQGQYLITRVPPGSYELTATSGDMTRKFEVTVEPQKTASLRDPACRGIVGVPDGGTLVGQICNRHTGQLIASAEVALILPNSELMLTTTDSEGNFEMTGVPKGDHVVRISGDGYQRSFNVHIEENETTTLDLADGCEPVSATEGGINGSFCNPELPEPDNNLQNAVVTITSADGGEGATDLTDLAGVFQVNGLPPGSYNVDVSHPDHSVAFFGVEVFPGQYTTLLDEANCDERPEFGRIEGQICDQDAGGRFVGTVELRDETSVLETTQSDSEGRFAFNGVEPGTYNVRAFTDGYERVYPGVVVEPFQSTLIQESDCPSPEDVCEEFTSAPTATADGRIMLIVDRSGSMGQALGGSGTSKWSAMTNALIQTTQALNENVEFGLMLFPDATSNQVPGACNEYGQVELGVGPNHAAQVENALDDSSPNGGTPTAQALAAAVGPLQATASDGRPLAVLLATDGAPNCDDSHNGYTCTCTIVSDQGNCNDHNCLDDVNTLNELGQIKDLGVSVYVLGLPGVENFSYVLNQMASIGGTALPGSTKFYEANDQAALEAAIDAITTRVLSCRVETSADLNGTDSITVSVDGQVVPRDQARQNGWDILNASTIELFGSACDLATASNDGVLVRTCNEP
jgi:Carboxypeptidase regulatory-like domain/von Willebrand factor type A domain